MLDITFTAQKTGREQDWRVDMKLNSVNNPETRPMGLPYMPTSKPPGKYGIRGVSGIHNNPAMHGTRIFTLTLKTLEPTTPSNITPEPIYLPVPFLFPETHESNQHPYL